MPGSGAKGLPPRKARSRPWTWAVWVLAGGLVAAGVTFLVTRQPSPTASSGLGVGQRAPRWALPSTAGHPLSLAAFRGHRVVLFFYEAAT